MEEHHFFQEGWQKTEAGRKDIADYPRPSEKEYQRRYKLLREEMGKRNLDCLVVQAPGRSTMNCANVRWLSNWGKGDAYQCYVVFPREGEPALFKVNKDPMHLGAALKFSVIPNVIGSLSLADDIVDYILKLGLEEGKIGLVTANPFRDYGISHRHMDIFRNRLPKAFFPDVTEWYCLIKAVKSPEEIGYMEKAAEVVDIGLEALVKALKPGVTDMQMRNVIFSAVTEAGGEPMGLNFGSTPMANPFFGCWNQQGNHVIQSGDIVNCEIIAEYMGLTSQRFHAITLGKPMKWVREMADVGVAAYEAIRKVLKPGATAEDMRNAGEPIYEKGGCDYFIMAHGIGMDMEYPKVQKEGVGVSLPGQGKSKGVTSPKVWQAKVGNTIMLEQTVLRDKVYSPYIEHLHKKYVMVGDVVLITENGNRRIHKTPVDMISI